MYLIHIRIEGSRRCNTVRVRWNEELLGIRAVFEVAASFGDDLSLSILFCVSLELLGLSKILVIFHPAAFKLKLILGIF